MKNVQRNVACIPKGIQLLRHSLIGIPCRRSRFVGDSIFNFEHQTSKSYLVFLFLILGAGFFAHAQDDRAENMQQALQNIFMSADQSYYKFNSTSDNDPYVYGYWVTAHALETLADAYQRTRNVVYYNRMKSILAGIRKYNRYGAGTYHNDYYDDLEWLCLACFNCYNATKDPEFLDAVHQIWTEIKTGYSGGKMSWRKGCTTPCNNSIANSPAIVIAVKLYKLEHDNANLQMAKDIHAWMKANVFNANGGIWDSPGNFDENWQFSYNSGMFLSACLELYIVTGTQSYLDDAIKACEYMMNFRNYHGGVFFLNENGQGDGGLFKGIFAKAFADFVRMGNLSASQRDRYLQVIHYTGNYAWNKAVNKSNFLIGPDWSVLPSGTIDLSTHTSGVHLYESIASLSKVHVYQDIHYSGFYSQLPKGTYTLAQLQARGIADNDITSMTVPAGYSVTVYENSNFTGASKAFTANTQWLSDWNDRISSVKIADVSGPVTGYQNVNFDGYAAGLDVGDYTLAQLQAKGIVDNDITSLKIAQGFKVTIYDGDNFTGASNVYTADTGWLADWNDRVTSLRVRPHGDQSLSGIYELQNRNSSLYMDVSGGPSSTGDGVNIHQWSLAQATNQQFLFEHTGDGAYKITAVNSGKALDVNSGGKDNGINVQQWSYYGFNNQQLIAVATGDGYYKLIAKHSGKLIEVAGFSTSNGGAIQQWENVNQSSGMWKLLRPTSSSARSGGSETILLSEENGNSIYPNPGKNGELIIALSKPSKQVWVSINDGQGKVLMKEQRQVKNSKVSVSVSSLSSGMYIIQVTDSEHTWTRKYFKE